MVNFDLEQLKAVGEPLVVVAAAAAAAADGEDGAADIDHHETVDADTSDPVAEHGDQGDLAERGDIAVVVVVVVGVGGGVAVEAAAVDVAELSSL